MNHYELEVADRLEHDRRERFQETSSKAMSGEDDGSAKGVAVAE